MSKKRNQEDPTELSSTVDIPTLKDLMKEAGCVITEGFEIELEKHLRILMARYIPRELKESYTSQAQMSKAMRSLFTGDIYSVGGGCLITEDKNAIRLWAKSFFDPKKRISLGLPQHIREHFLALAEMKGKAAFTIAQVDIMKPIPKTIQHRMGHHKYVLFSFGKKKVVINNSKSGDSLQSEVCVLSDVLATNLLLVKDQDVIVRLIRRKGKKNLLVTGSQFEIFFK